MWRGLFTRVNSFEDSSTFGGFKIYFVRNIYRTELIWVDIAETSRFCSRLEEILSFRYFGGLFVEPLCDEEDLAELFIQVNSFEDSGASRLARRMLQDC